MVAFDAKTLTASSIYRRKIDSHPVIFSQFVRQPYGHTLCRRSVVDEVTVRFAGGTHLEENDTGFVFFDN